MISATPAPAQEFTLFPKLAKELQIMVWEFSLPGPRVVKILYRGDGEEAKCTSRARIPAALHVCRDSREVAKKVYKLSFGLNGTSKPQGSTWQVPGKVYFDFSLDTLFIDVEVRAEDDRWFNYFTEEKLAEAARFYSLVNCVQDLHQVRPLAAWKSLVILVCYYRPDDSPENPWTIFTGVRGAVYGVNVLGSVDERDLEFAAPSDTMRWGIEAEVSRSTGLTWKQVDIVSS